MNDLRTRLTELSERGTERGVDELRDRVLLDLARRSGRARLPGWAVAVAAAVIALVVIGTASILFGGVDGSIAPSGPIDGSPPSTVTSPPSTVMESEESQSGTIFADGPIGYGIGPEPDGRVTATTSGGVMWAWDEFGGQIWRHTGDGWAALPIAPAPVIWVEYGGGTVWAALEIGFADQLYRLEGDEWIRPGVMRTSVHFAVDAVSGVVWTSTGAQLMRWDDDGRPSDVGAPVFVEEDFSWSYVGDIAVTSEGTVWAGGFNGYMWQTGSLSAYHDDTGEWEIVAPWKGDPTPAIDLATTDGGDLWAILVGPTLYDEGDPDGRSDWALAHLDGDTGRWTVHDTGLPQGEPHAIAANDEAVWIINTGDLPNYSEPIDGLYRFDGSTWTHYLDGAEVRDVIVAPNGTVWYLIYGLNGLNSLNQG